MRFLSLRLIAGVFVIGVMPLVASAATISYGPSAYLQHGDTPLGFKDPACTLSIEDFEDDELHSFLSIDNGSILPPNSFSGASLSVTDSVDGDDGNVDGNGNAGYSWFSGNGINQMTVTFDSAVHCAGLVFTDGDPISTLITLEALDGMGNVLGTVSGDLADGTFTGETAEDAFMGFSDMMTGITALRISMTGGDGIEIDHIHWGNCPAVPEPAAISLVLMGLLGLVGQRRRKR